MLLYSAVLASVFLATEPSANPKAPEPIVDATHAGQGADPEGGHGETQPQIGVFAVSASITPLWVAPAQVDGGGEVSRLLIAGSLDLDLPVSEKLTLSAHFGAASAQYDFNRPALLPGNVEPWSDVAIYDISFAARYSLNPQWTLFGSTSVISSGEPEAEFSETLTYGGAIGGLYALDDSLTIGALLFIQTRLEDDTIILPFPMLEWTLPVDDDGRWRLSVGGSRNAGIAAGGIGLTYRASDTVNLSAGVAGFGFGGEYRLSRRGPVPEGVGRDSSTSILLGIDWKATSALDVNAFVGASVFGEIEILDSAGRRVAKKDLDPAPMVGLTLRLSY